MVLQPQLTDCWRPQRFNRQHQQLDSPPPELTTQPLVLFPGHCSKVTPQAVVSSTEPVPLDPLTQQLLELDPVKQELDFTVAVPTLVARRFACCLDLLFLSGVPKSSKDSHLVPLSIASLFPAVSSLLPLVYGLPTRRRPSEVGPESKFP